MVLYKTTLFGYVFILCLFFVIGCETDDCSADKNPIDDPREGKAYYTVRIVDQTGVDQLSKETPGTDVDAVALVKGTNDPVYADMVMDHGHGATEPYEGLEDPELALGAPAWPDGNCLREEVEFFGMGGYDGYVVVSFGDLEIEPGDTIQVYDCENSLAVESYDVAVGASGNGVDFSFYGIAQNATGIMDFVVPDLPPLPVSE